MKNRTTSLKTSLSTKQAKKSSLASYLLADEMNNKMSSIIDQFWTVTNENSQCQNISILTFRQLSDIKLATQFWTAIVKSGNTQPPPRMIKLPIVYSANIMDGSLSMETVSIGSKLLKHTRARTHYRKIAWSHTGWELQWIRAWILKDTKNALLKSIKTKKQTLAFLNCVNRCE